MMSRRALLQALSTARKVLVVEPRSGWWSSNPAWGRTVSVFYPPAENTVQSVARIDNMPGPPQVQTIILGRNPPQDSLLMPGNACWNALITYGVGAVSQQFECDWGPGTQLSLVASSITVDAVSRQAFAGVAYAPVPNQQITLTVGFGRQSAQQGQSTLTVPRLVGAAARADIRIPLFANRWIVQPQNVGDDANVYGANFTYNGIAGTYFAPNVWTPVVRQNGLLLSIQNNTLAAVPLKVIFGLSL